MTVSDPASKPPVIASSSRKPDKDILRPERFRGREALVDFGEYADDKLAGIVQVQPHALKVC